MTPSTLGPAGGRWALAAGLAFLEGAATESWGLTGVRGWFQDHLVAGGYMRPPVSVNEPPVGTFTLYPRDAGPHHPQASLPALLSLTRNVVLGTLRAFVDDPADDRFVRAALFSGRVQRARRPTPGAAYTSGWIPRPDPDGPLSALVLGVFVVDMLTHREGYDRSLCVCDVCGRVSFQEAVARRRTCALHGARPSSLLQRVVAP